MVYKSGVRFHAIAPTIPSTDTAAAPMNMAFLLLLMSLTAAAMRGGKGGTLTLPGGRVLKATEFAHQYA
jgi:hypothetical protein